MKLVVPNLCPRALHCQEIPDSAALMASYSKLTVLLLAKNQSGSQGRGEVQGRHPVRRARGGRRWRDVRRCLQGWLGGHCLQTPDRAVRIRPKSWIRSSVSALGQACQITAAALCASSRKLFSAAPSHLFCSFEFRGNCVSSVLLKVPTWPASMPPRNIRASSNARGAIVY